MEVCRRLKLEYLDKVRKFLGTSKFVCFSPVITSSCAECTESQEPLVYPCEPLQNSDSCTSSPCLTGRHCCLWCHITSQQLKLDPSSVNVTLRSLDTLTDDHRAFVAAGGDVSKVKEFNNALYEPFFDLCIEQVLNYPYRLQIHAHYKIYEHVHNVLGVNARSPH